MICLITHAFELLIMSRIDINFICSEHYEEIKARCTNNVYRRHEAEFPKWFKQRVSMFFGNIAIFLTCRIQSIKYYFANCYILFVLHYF